MVHGYMRRQAKEYEMLAWGLTWYYNWNRSKGKPALKPHKLLPAEILRLLGQPPASPANTEDKD